MQESYPAVDTQEIGDREPGDCRWKPCDGCEIAQLPEPTREKAANALSKIEERAARGGIESDKHLVLTVRQKVGGMQYVAAGNAVLGAFDRRRIGRCYLD